MKQPLFILIFCCVCLGVAGCSNGNFAKPEGFPKLYPVTLALTQESQPLAEATITLIAENPTKWGTSGFSNAEGKVELKTGGFAGVPAGKFKAVVVKTVSEGVPASADDVGDPKTYTLVEKVYTDPATSTLKLDIAPDTKELPLDAGKTVKIRID